MLKRILFTAVTFLLVTSSVHATRTVDTLANTDATDDADDVQTVNITVPEVALLDMSGTGSDQGIVSITVPAVTVAGSGLATTATAETVTYALTSNVASTNNATTQTRTLAVSMAGHLPAGGQLTITSIAGTENGDAVTHSEVTLTTTGDSGNIASAIRNVAAPSESLTYALAPSAPNGTMSFTGTNGTSSESVTLTFTLSAVQ